MGDPLRHRDRENWRLQNPHSKLLKLSPAVLMASKALGPIEIFWSSSSWRNSFTTSVTATSPVVRLMTSYLT